MGKLAAKTVPARGSGSKPTPRHGGGKERKKGFHVGPDHAPRDAYLGKGENLPLHTRLEETHFDKR